MEFHKNIVITIVAVLVLTSTSATIYIVTNTKRHREDVIYTFVISVFAAGLLRGVGCFISFITCWFRLQHIQIILKLFMVVMILSNFASYFSLAAVTTTKAFAVVAPFVFRRRITSRLVKIVTLMIWVVCICLLMPLFISGEYIFGYISQRPILLYNNQVVLIASKVLSVFNNAAIIILALSSLVLFVMAVKHKLRDRMSVAPSGADAELTNAITKALWSAKGALVLSTMRLTLHVPFFVLLETHFKDSEAMFYIYWAIISGPFWDAVCYIGCSPSLRQYVMTRFLKTGGANNSDNGNISDEP